MVGLLYEAPSSEHILGTDNFGRDVFVELLYGMKTSMFVGLLAGLIATLIGMVIGLTSGYIGRMRRKNDNKSRCAGL